MRLDPEPSMEPRERFIPICPNCGEETETLKETLDHAIIGCPMCADEDADAVDVSSFDYYGLDEFGRRARLFGYW